MWWRSSALFAVLFAGLSGLALSGCGFQPLYGGTTAGAKALRSHGRRRCRPIPGRVGQEAAERADLRQYRRQPGGRVALPARDRHQESVTDQLVQITGDATGQVYQLDATFQLIDSASGKVLLQGKAISRAPITGSRKFSPMCARATTPRPAPPAPCRRASRPRCGLLTNRRLGSRLVCPRNRAAAPSPWCLQIIAVANFVKAPRRSAAAVLVYGPDADWWPAGERARSNVRPAQRGDRGGPARRSRSRRGSGAARSRTQNRADVRGAERH